MRRKWRLSSRVWHQVQLGLFDFISYVLKCVDKAWEQIVPSNSQRKGFDVKQISVSRFHALVKTEGHNIKVSLLPLPVVRTLQWMRYHTMLVMTPHVHSVNVVTARITEPITARDLRRFGRNTNIPSSGSKNTLRLCCILVWCRMITMLSSCDSRSSTAVL